MVAFSTDELDRTFAALAHPTRRALLTRLGRQGAATVSELAEPFQVSVMAISKHLSLLEEAGLVRKERDGRTMRCRIDPTGMEDAATWIETHRRFWEGRLDALVRVFDADDDPPSRSTP